MEVQPVLEVLGQGRFDVVEHDPSVQLDMVRPDVLVEDGDDHVFTGDPSPVEGGDTQTGPLPGLHPLVRAESLGKPRSVRPDRPLVEGLEGHEFFRQSGHVLGAEVPVYEPVEPFQIAGVPEMACGEDFDSAMTVCKFCMPGTIRPILPGSNKSLPSISTVK